MEKLNIKAQKREKEGVKGVLNAARANRQIPAVVYGEGKKPISITVEKKDMDILLKTGSNAIIDLQLDKETEKVILKEVAHDVVNGHLIHADFQRISMNKKLETAVPIKLKGEEICPAVKAHGALIDHSLRELQIRCLPTDIPHDITVDISNLDVGASVTIADLKMPEGVEIIADDMSLVVVHPIIPRGEEIEAPKPEAEEEQPEVIEKGKKEEVKEGKEVKEAEKPAAKEQPKKEQPKQEKK
jgi:large subunit ribosomal protein L25